MTKGHDKHSLYWVYIFGGEGKKYYVLTKCVKTNTFLFSLGIFQ